MSRVVLAALVATAGCTAVLGIHEVQQDPVGSTGATTSTAAQGGGGAGGSGGQGGSGGSGGAEPVPPPPARLVTPMLGAYVGVVHVPATLRPVFTWEASQQPGVEYDIELADNVSFSNATLERVTSATYQPATPLTVADMPPVGTKYYWHVRACSTGGCSNYTKAKWLYVGRPVRDGDGDGFDDLRVGAPDDPQGSYNPGSIYHYRGGTGTSFDETVDWIVRIPSQENAWNGSKHVASLDFDGDGYADTIGGAGDYDQTFGNPVWFWRGAATGPDSNTYTSIAGGTDDNGRAVARAGDVNGDGFADAIVGAPNVGKAAKGHASIALGTTTDPPFANVVTLTGEQVGDHFGERVAPAGDVDGDGFDDVLVAAPASNGGTRVYLFLGNNTGISASPAATLSMPAKAGFGQAFASAGDMNGDGFVDVAVADPTTDTVYVYFGSFGGMLAALPDLTLSAGSGFGTGIVSLGDTNADGYADLAVAAPKEGAGGVIAIFLGGPSPSATPAGTFEATAPTTALGTLVTASDLNGDGVLDLAATTANTRVEVFLSGTPNYPTGTHTANGILVGPTMISFGATLD